MSPAGPPPIADPDDPRWDDQDRYVGDPTGHEPVRVPHRPPGGVAIALALAMSVQRWVRHPDDQAAHLLRASARLPGAVTARCALVLDAEHAIVTPTAPEQACEVCVGLHRLDEISTEIEALMVAPDVSARRRHAPRDVLATGEPDG